MSKTSPEKLLNEISDDFNTFLKSGVCLNSFTRKIDPQLNINDIERLLRIHFVLTEDNEGEKGVINFVKTLPQYLRRIKTTVKIVPEVYENEIRGKINWSKTFIERNRQDPTNKRLFVCDTIEKQYDIYENLILKKLLSIINSIIYVDLMPAIENDYTWIKDWSDDKKLKLILKNVFLKNVYIRRMISEDKIFITDRMINIVKKSRNRLYRDAAELFSYYRKLLNYEIDPEEAKLLLSNTFIKPEKTEVLFELYWVFKIIKELTSGTPKDIKFNIIDGSNNIVAEWEENIYLYKIYHDSVGNFGFKESFENLKIPEKDGYLAREGIALKKWEELNELLFDLDKTGSLWGGRPDVILEEYIKKTGKINKILIGEVKYTESNDYASQGLKELLEYMSLIRKDQNYYYQKGEIFHSDKIRGYLFTDNINCKPLDLKVVRVIKFDDVRKINWLQFS